MKKPTKKLENSSFYQNIYLRRKELKNLQVLKDSKCWPKSVYVMDEDFCIDGPVWVHPVNEEPCTIYSWAELHFKQLYNAPLDQVIHAIRIWWGLYEQVCTYLILKKDFKAGESERLAYNTTWTLLGYEVGQEPAALDIAHTIMLDPSFETMGLDIKHPALNKDILTNAQKETAWKTAQEYNEKFGCFSSGKGQEGTSPSITFRTASRGSSENPKPRPKKKPSAGLKGFDPDEEDAPTKPAPFRSKRKAVK